MQTLEAVYDCGRIIFKDSINISKAKVLVTIIEELEETNINAKSKQINFPTKNLGKIKKINRRDIYEEYLSN